MHRGGGEPLNRSTESRAINYDPSAPIRHCEELATKQSSASELRLEPFCQVMKSRVQNAKLPLHASEQESGRNASVSQSYALDNLDRCYAPAGLPRGLRPLAMTCAFTMAEILLSLTIIGVVAAITLPSLTGNINERTWNTQRKALYARFSQAISLMPAINGYGKYSGTNDGTGTGNVIVTEDTAAETFLTAGLSKVMKINNICDATHLTDCGIPAEFTNLTNSKVTWPKKLSELNIRFTNTFVGSTESGSTYSRTNPQKDIDTKVAAFETGNGESVALYYNPFCVADTREQDYNYIQPYMCANFIYDLNGTKGPNTVGKDIGFVTVLYSTDSTVVAPMPLTRDVSSTPSQINAGKACTAMDSESRVPNHDETAAMFYNRSLVGIESGSYWSGSVYSSEMGWAQSYGECFRYLRPRAYETLVRCIKR